MKMKLVNKSRSAFDGAMAFLAVFAGILVIFMMLAVDSEIVMRYFWGRPIVWVTEITEYCLLFITFLSAAWLLKRDKHVRMDLVLNKLEPNVRAISNIITSILGALVCLALTWFGTWVTIESFQLGYAMSSELETPEFIILSIIPIGSFMLFIQFLRMAYGLFRYRRTGSGKEAFSLKKS